MGLSLSLGLLVIGTTTAKLALRYEGLMWGSSWWRRPARVPHRLRVVGPTTWEHGDKLSGEDYTMINSSRIDASTLTCRALYSGSMAPTSSQPCKRLKCSTLELGAQLNRTSDQKERKSYLQAWPVPGILMLQLRISANAWAVARKERLSRLQAMRTLSSRKGEARSSGTLFNITTSDKWDNEIRLAVALYWNELLGWKL